MIERPLSLDRSNYSRDALNAISRSVPSTPRGRRSSSLPRVSQTPSRPSRQRDRSFTRKASPLPSSSSSSPSSSDPRRGKWTAANGQTEKHARSEKPSGESLRRRRRANHARTVNKLFQTLQGRGEDSCNPLTCRYTRDTQPIFHGSPFDVLDRDSCQRKFRQGDFVRKHRSRSNELIFFFFFRLIDFWNRVNV